MAKGELGTHPNVFVSAPCTVSMVPAIVISHTFRDYNFKLNFIGIGNILLIKDETMNLT